MTTGTTTTVAIIGGGQLGTMLCEAARGLGIATVVVTADSAAPALRLADRSLLTSLAADGLARRIAAEADVVTFEFENVPAALLRNLHREARRGSVRVAPGIAIMELLQNKARQKDWLVRHGFPTAPYEVVATPRQDARRLVARFGLPLVQKSQVGGYDGYGVQKVTTTIGLDGLWDVPSVIEPAVAMTTELAVLVARDGRGDTAVYAPITLDVDADRNVLRQIVAPGALPEEVARRARELGRDVVAALDAVGVFAIEMFLTTAGELLINEISPRVHNTGHHTGDSCLTSQFEQHMRAVAGLPLGSAATRSPAVMRNLLYTDELAPLLSLPPGRVPTGDPDVSLYWYGKREARPFRKMGHIVCRNVAPSAAGERAATALANVLRRCDEQAA